MVQSELRDGYWPSVSTREAATKTARWGLWAAVFCAAATAIVTVLSSSGVQLFGPGAFGPWTLIDIGLFLLVAWGISRHSRLAAVLGLLLSLFERITMWMTHGLAGGGGVFLTLLLVLSFVHGIRGTFAYHRDQAGLVRPTS